MTNKDDMSDLKHSLQDTPLGQHLNAAELDMLVTHTKPISFAKGEIILRQGAVSAGIYIILAGSVITTAKLLGEGTANIETLEVGDFLGEISFIENGPCATSVTTTSPVKCLLITRSYFDLLAVYFPTTHYKILHLIALQVCERLKNMHDKLILLIKNKDLPLRSFLSEIMHSLSKPTELTLEEAGIKLEALKKSPFFAEFSSEECDVLLSHLQLIKVPKNCTLIHEGEKSPVCYIVIYGAVQSSIVEESKVAKLSVIGPVTLFASISCIEAESPFTITFNSCEPAILFTLTAEHLALIQKNNQVLWYKVFALICRSLVALGRSIDKLDIRLNIEAFNK